MPNIIRFSTFNCENLFSRPRAMNAESWEENRSDLEEIKELDELIAKSEYNDADKSRMAEIIQRNRAKKPKERYFNISEVRERLYSVKDDVVTIKAKGRAAWVGWIELTRDDFDSVTVHNTGRVIQKVNADVQLMVEIEDRLTMERFNRQVLEERLQMQPFPYSMLIDGNDDRGIDLGLFSRLPVVSLRSHIADGGLDTEIFSRDCPEYEVVLPDGAHVWLLGNHFKSKGFGDKKKSDARRKAQAQRVAEIYHEARRRSDFVIVAGDLNDFPGSDPLKPLLMETDLRDVMTHSLYEGLPGTFDTCTSEEKKIDYILLSPALWERVRAVDAERSGIWAPNAFKKAGIQIMATVTSDDNSASDHAAVWVDLEF